MAQIIPLPSFLLASSPTHIHPFVFLAYLHHAIEVDRIHLADALDESLIYLLSGAVSPDVMLALLILSLAPVQPVSNGRNRPSAWHLITLAYNVGIGLGLDYKVAEDIKRGDLCERWARHKMELAQLVSRVWTC
jgi:hypothetical protein